MICANTDVRQIPIEWIEWIEWIAIRLRQPGVEPGSTAWKAAMLTVIPLTLTLAIEHCI